MYLGLTIRFVPSTVLQCCSIAPSPLQLQHCAVLWNLLYTRGPVAAEILFPVRFILLSKFIQHIPIVQTGVVSVIEKDLDCILADWGNIDVQFSGNQHGNRAPSW